MRILVGALVVTLVATALVNAQGTITPQTYETWMKNAGTANTALRMKLMNNQATAIGPEAKQLAQIFAGLVPPQHRLHPSRREEDIARLLNLSEHAQGRHHESCGVRRTERMIQVHQRLDDPGFAPALHRITKPLERAFAH